MCCACSFFPQLPGLASFLLVWHHYIEDDIEVAAAIFGGQAAVFNPQALAGSAAGASWMVMLPDPAVQGGYRDLGAQGCFPGGDGQGEMQIVADGVEIRVGYQLDLQV